MAAKRSLPTGAPKDIGHCQTNLTGPAKAADLKRSGLAAAHQTEQQGVAYAIHQD